MIALISQTCRNSGIGNENIQTNRCDSTAENESLLGCNNDATGNGITKKPILRMLEEGAGGFGCNILAVSDTNTQRLHLKGVHNICIIYFC